ncbi:MAG: hypothetical protein PHP26_04520 [Syntrophomonas sp.]|uniref:hypothetical protein n=1 Tax=Syntrophomonas sp. TaxID=2053627 RepID=UPI00261CF735|nr:hypothetical protein [Syntrophomonas sp.]MDD2510328.1 hypothetical protein [Syntrophomonas sp.]MDD3879239.1 hypothetical protein [Syntrophomonas sp.]MDD4626002.1 hypothetical protein [Syntrophomonas sp.]
MPDYRHMQEMSRENGILQFSHLDKADSASGFTLDDNARALILAMEMPGGREYAVCYTSFLDQSQQKDGSWSNFMLDGHYSSLFNSDDSVGRALLACSLGSSSPWPEISEKCQEMLLRNLPRAFSFQSPRAIAYTLIGLCKCQWAGLGARQQDSIKKLGEFLINLYQGQHSRKWLWFEDYLTYCNGILPQAMFALYQQTADKKALKIGYDSLNFLNSILFRQGYLNIIGNDGWYFCDQETALFDQQPVDAASTAFACMEAYESIGEIEFLELAILAHKWYRGHNIHGLSLYNAETGGCYDALTPEGVNLNQGAEAVLSLLLSDKLMKNFIGEKVDIDQSS